MSKQRKSNRRTSRPPQTESRQAAEPSSTTSSGGDSAAQRDVGFVSIIVLLAFIALWLLLMPWVKPISWTSMRRFHLATSSFVAWAAQFPIPAMYNFANRAEVDRYPPGLVDPLFDETERRHLNHFPARCITFADGRYRHFHEGQDRWITIDTSYRGRTLETRFHAKAKPGGRFELIRLDDAEASR